MADEPPQRRLAAIVVIDVVGYSKLMEADEEGTLAVLRQRRSNVLDPVVRRHHGRIVKLMGDGALIEFASAVNAVKAALELQVKMDEANDGHPDERRVVLRVGINLGDVVGQGSDIYGEGVNIAARLEALAQPGEISISAKVRDEVIGKVEAIFEDTGLHHLKNIAEPVRIFAVRRSEVWRARDVGLELPSKPSIAVLAFTNMSCDSEQEHLSDGISEDIITALSKLSKLFVVARNSTFTYKGRPVDVKQIGREQGVRYVLEGSVRRAGNRLRVSAQLIDATTGNHIWADRYDRPVQDVFDLQDEITRQVTAALQVELTDGERARLWASGTANLEAWQAAIQAWELLENHRKEDVLPARRLAQRALHLDSDYAVAWTLLGWSHWIEAFNGWTDDPDVALAQASEALERARSIDGTNPDTLSLLAMLHISLRKLDEAGALAEKALLFSPNDSFAAGVAANVALFSNRPHEAVQLLKRARRLCPVCPAWYIADLAYAYVIMNRLDDAIKTAIEATKIDPDYIYSYHVLAIANAELGRMDAANSAAANILRIEPNWLISTFAKTQPFADQRLQRRLLEGFRDAGLPGAVDLPSGPRNGRC